MSSRPTENFTQIMRFVRILNSCVGADIYDKNYRFNKITALVVLAVLVYVSCTLITVINESDWMFTVQAIVMSGSVIQGVNKLFVAVTCSHKIYELNHHVFEIYEEYEQQPDPRFAEALLKNCRRLRSCLRWVGINYLVGVTGMVVTPLVATKLTGKVNYIMHFPHIPVVDVETDTGVWITQGVQIATLVMGGVGLYGGDLVIVVHLLQSFVFSDILRLKIDIFNKFVENTGDEQQESHAELMLTDIAKFHQIYLKFISQCNEIFYSIVSVQISTSAVCIIITAFVLLTTDWPGGYIFAIGLIPNMYIYCILGTLLENCNEHIMYEMYNISFFNLNVRQQRLVLIMLCRSQTADLILLLGIMPLTVGTAYEITKSIYSICMMMVEFLLE